MSDGAELLLVVDELGSDEHGERHDAGTSRVVRCSHL
jgi:hypothetical protein